MITPYERNISRVAGLLREGGLLIAVFGPVDVLIQRYSDHPAITLDAGPIHWEPIGISLLLGFILMGYGLYLGRNFDDH